MYLMYVCVDRLMTGWMDANKVCVCLYIYTRCSKGGAKAPPISRDVPSLRRSAVPKFRFLDIPAVRPKTPELKPETPELKPETSELKPETPKAKARDPRAKARHPQS